jgi:hypothetical protein
MARKWLTSLWVAWSLSLSAAAAADPACQPLHFIVLPGIEGPSGCTRGVIQGLLAAHPHASAEVFDWTTGKWYRCLYHLRDWERNQAVAKALAQHIQSFHADHPNTPMVLVGHSGGAAMTILGLEQLSADCMVDQAILLAPGLSSGYPLAPALSRTRRGVDVFHSPLDCVILGVGTVCLGTIDRRWQLSAGMIGFEMPKDADAACRDIYRCKLRHHHFRPTMCRSGHFGGHLSCTFPDFIRTYVGPLVNP